MMINKDKNQQYENITHQINYKKDLIYWHIKYN